MRNQITIRQSLYISLLLWGNIGCQGSDPTQKKGWQGRHPEIILDSLPGQNLYQIKVLNQKHNECSLHQKRNLLFATSMLQGSPQKFLSEYQRMVDNDLLEQMAAMTVCLIEDPHEKDYFIKNLRGKPIPGGAHIIRMEPDIKKFIDDHSNFADFLPIDSREQLGQILSHERDFADLKENESLAAHTLPLIEKERPMEKNFSTDQAGLITDITSWLRRNDNIVELYKLSQKLNKLGDFLIPISLGLNSVGTIKHATSFIVHKKNGALEYIFMDPLNWRVSSTKTYKKAINSLLRLISNPEYYKESLIRSGYMMTFEKTKDPAKFRERIYFAFPFFGYLGVLENLSLLEDPFFVTYYQKPTCDLIKTTLPKPPIAVELKPGTYDEDFKQNGAQRIRHADAQAELWRRFKCVGIR